MVKLLLIEITYVNEVAINSFSLHRKKRAHTISGSRAGTKGRRGGFNRSKFAESAPQPDQAQEGSGWRFLETRRRPQQELPKESGWFEGPMSSPRQSENDKLSRTASRSQYSDDSRGARRATGAARGSGPAAKSGW